MAIKKVEYKIEVGTSGEKDVKDMSKSLLTLESTLSKTIGVAVGVNQGLELLSKGFNLIKNAVQSSIQPLIEYDSLQKKLAVSGVSVVENNKDIVDSVKEIQRQFGENPEQIADALFQAIKTGAIDSSNSLEYMTTVTKLATASFSDIGTTSETVSKVMNTYGKNISDVAGISETLLIASKNSALGFQEFSQFMGKGITVARQAGLSFEQYAASLATVTKLGFEARQGMSAFQSVIDQVIKPSDELTKIYQELGITNISAAINTKTFSGVLNEIIQKANSSGTSLLNLFGSIEGVTIATELSSNKNKDFISTLDQLAKSSKNSGDILNTTFKTVDAQISESLQDISARFSLLKTNLAETFAGSTIASIKFVADLMKGVTYVDFSQLINSLGELIKSLSIFIGVLLTATALVATLAFTLFPGFALAITTVAARLWLMVAPMVAIGKAAFVFTAITAGIVTLITAIDVLVRNFTNLWNVVKTVFNLIMSGINSVVSSIIVFVKKLGIGVSTLQGMENALDANAQVFAEWAAETGKDVDFGFAGDAIEQISNISKGFDTVTEAQKKTSSESDDLQKKIEKIKLPDFKVEDKSILNLYDQLIGKTKTLEDSIAKASMTEIEYLSHINKKNIEEINGISNKLKSQGNLTKEREAAIKKIIALTKEQSTIEIIAAQKKLEVEKLSSSIDIAKILGDDTKVYQLEYEKQSQELKTKLDNGLIDVLQYHDAVEQLEKDANKKSIDLLRTQQQEADKILGAGTKTLEIEYQKRIEKIQELQAKGAISPEQGKVVAKQAKIETNIQKPFTELGDMAAQSFLGNVASGIRGVQAGVSSVMGGVVGVILKAPQIFEGLIDMVDGLMQSWLDLPTKIFDKFVASNEKLMEFPQKLLSSLGDNLPRISEYFSKSIADTGPRLISSILKGIPRLIAGLIKSIPAIIRGFINGFVDGILSLGQTIKDIFSGNFDFSKVEEAGTKAVDAVGKSVTGVGEQLFGFVEASGAQQAQSNVQAITQATSNSAGVFERLWAKLTDIWNKFYNKFKPVIDFFVSYFTSFFGVISAFVDAIFNTIMPSITFLIDGIIGAFDLLGITLAFAFDTLKWLFVDIIWGTVLKPAIDLFKWLFVDIVYGLVFEPVINTFMMMWNFVKTLFDDPIQAFKNLWADFKGIFSGIWDRFNSAAVDLGKIFTDFLSGIGSAFIKGWEVISQFGSKIGTWFEEGWVSFKTFVSDIGSAIWNGIKGAWGSVKNFFSDLFKIEPSAGTVETWMGLDFPWVNFAEGGFVGGTAKVAGDSLKNDTVPALLSAGEYVLPRSVTQNKDLMKLISALINSGKKVEMKAGGDNFWSDTWNKAKSVGSSVVDTVSSAGSAVWEGAKDVGKAVVEGASWVGDLLVPDWIQGMYDSMSRFFSNLSLTELVKNPLPYATKVLKDGLSVFFKDPLLGGLKGGIKSMIGFANGGLVPQGTDTVPAMLTPGEYVLNRDAVSGLGAGFLDRLNSGSMGGSQGVTNQNIEVTLNIKTEQPIDERYIKQTLMPTIRDELRRMSLDGRRVLSTSGVR